MKLEGNMAYRQAARWYDTIYSFKDYAAEAESLRALVAEAPPGARRLLDVERDCGPRSHDLVGRRKTRPPLTLRLRPQLRKLMAADEGRPPLSANIPPP